MVDKQHKATFGTTLSHRDLALLYAAAQTMLHTCFEGLTCSFQQLTSGMLLGEEVALMSSLLRPISQARYIPQDIMAPNRGCWRLASNSYVSSGFRAVAKPKTPDLKP